MMLTPLPPVDGAPRAITFVVNGRPRTKGSLRAFCMKNRAHTIRIQEEVKDSGLWRSRMARAAQDAMLVGGPRVASRLWNSPHPVKVVATFVFVQEVGIDGQVMPTHRTASPTSIHLGDLDKLLRNLLDALVDAHAINDDSQVVSLDAVKIWGSQHMCCVDVREMP